MCNIELLKRVRLSLQGLNEILKSESPTEISSRVKALVLRTNPGDEPSAELIQKVFLLLLDDSPGWEEIYAHTSRVVLQNFFTSNKFRERVHQLIAQELTSADMAGQRSEGRLDVLTRMLITVEEVWDNLLAHRNGKTYFEFLGSPEGTKCYS